MNDRALTTGAEFQGKRTGNKTLTGCKTGQECLESRFRTDAVQAEQQHGEQDAQECREGDGIAGTTSAGVFLFHAARLPFS